MSRGSDCSNVLVTGGTGFVGRSVVRRLVASGRSVRVMSRSGNFPAHPRVTTHRGDVTRRDDLRAALRGCDAVFHCAAEKDDPEAMAAVNITATRLLFDLAREERVGFFCHLSSVGVIGKTRLRVVDETTPCNPMNAYEETKLAAEEIVGQGLDDGRVVILRPTNIFAAHTLQPWLEWSLRSRVRRFLHGREVSHLVYVEDVAAAATYGLQTSSTGRVNTFIVSSDEETGNTWREVHAALASRNPAAHRPLRFSAPSLIPFCVRLIKNGHSNFGDVIYSSRRLRQAGFAFPYGLQSGLNQAIDLPAV